MPLAVDGAVENLFGSLAASQVSPRAVEQSCMSWHSGVRYELTGMRRMLATNVDRCTARPKMISANGM